MKMVPLTRGYVALVDDEDFDKVAKFKWCAATKKTRQTIYAVRFVGNRKQQRTILMHRFLLGFPHSCVDHKDRNGLNNQRSNLRLATASQQNANKTKWKVKISSPNRFKGVTKSGDKWRAGIKINGQFRHLGSFATDIEAAKTYDQAALESFGEFSCINFPPVQNSTGT